MSKKITKNSSRPTKASRRFELSDGKSHKYWEIRCSRNTHVIRFGRIGTTGQEKIKEFADAATAKADAERLIQQKRNKGYREAKSGGQQVRGGAPISAHVPVSSSFPKLSWIEYQWEGQIKLPAWRGCQTRLGPYSSTSSRRKSTGKFHLVVMTLDEQKVIPSAAQIRAVEYLVEHQDAVRLSVMKAVYSKYGDLGRFFDAQDVELLCSLFGLPMKFSNIDEVAQHMGPSCIYIHANSRGGTAYVGYGFGCDWDEEHGLGVMTLRNQVLDVGGEDVAFTNLD